MNCRAIVYTLLFNICRSPTFYKNFHPTQWNVLFIKNITILIFFCFLITEKNTISPPPQKKKKKKKKKAMVFARTKLSISNEEIYLARSKESREFHKRNGHFFVYEHKLFEFIWILMTHNSLTLSA